ncbi:MAG: 50S ribosomal protein L11 methyltransferase [Alphaproteobacteria bacterium]
MPPAGAIVLTIDAATAFGTGSHETTRGCLLMLEGLTKKYRQVSRVLDMGCGTGILGFAASQLWPLSRKVLGVDLDPASVRVANGNARLNHLTPFFTAVAGPGYRAPGVTRLGPYDLIVANILAPPLIAMAGELHRHLARKGIAILSGFLFHQERQVLTRHEAYGLRRIARLRLGDWMIVALRRD